MLFIYLKKIHQWQCFEKIKNGRVQTLFISNASRTKLNKAMILQTALEKQEMAKVPYASDSWFFYVPNDLRPDLACAVKPCSSIHG